MDTAIEQVKLHDGTKLTTIWIGRMGHERALNLKARLDGQTFMLFEIILAPAGGELAVTARTTYDASADEILRMFIFNMACELARA